MKRFRWPLQRLLDVTVHRERALRAELLTLFRDMAGLRQEILRRRATLRSLLDDIARLSIEQRVARRKVLADVSMAAERGIRRLKDEWKRLDSARSEKQLRLLKTRASRKALSRLRNEARQRHVREELRDEQKQFDEGAHISFARKALEGRASGVKEVGV